MDDKQQPVQIIAVSTIPLRFGLKAVLKIKADASMLEGQHVPQASSSEGVPACDAR